MSPAQSGQQLTPTSVPTPSRYNNDTTGAYSHYFQSAPSTSAVDQAAAYYASTSVHNASQPQGPNNANVSRVSRSPSVLQAARQPRDQLSRTNSLNVDRRMHGQDMPPTPAWDQSLADVTSDVALLQQQQQRQLSHSFPSNTADPYESVANCICRSLGQSTCTCGASSALHAAAKTELKATQSPFTTTVQLPAAQNEQQWQTHASRYAAALHHGANDVSTAPGANQGNVQRPPLLSSSSADASLSFLHHGGDVTSAANTITPSHAASASEANMQYPQSAHLYSSFPVGSGSAASTMPAMRHSTSSTGTSAWPSNATNYSATSSSSWSADHRSSNLSTDMPTSYLTGSVTPTHAPTMTTTSSSDGGSQVQMSPYIDSRRGSGGQRQQYYVPFSAAAAAAAQPLSNYGNQARSGTGRTYEGTLGFDMGQLTSDVSMQYAGEEARWDAVTRRSHAADSHFIYGALTTRIFCRPSCASKRPDRGRVQYFMFPNAAAKAEAAGFRACKRCKPGTPGTADVCVLAVGECLRHMTRAALLGESDEVDKRLKKRTLKQYSSDYGVSAFHFHRTLKSVSTLTPGEYSKAAHSLVLQDEIGMDRHGRALEAEELNRKLRGWSARRARRALGNVLPQIYATGLADVQTRYISANTVFGTTVVLYALPDGHSNVPVGQSAAMVSASGLTHPFTGAGLSAGMTAGQQNETTNFSIVAVLLGDDALQRVSMRAPHAQRDDTRTQWLAQLVNTLASKGTREVQMPREVIYWVRRARIYLTTKNAMETPGSNPNNSPSVARATEGDPFDDEEFE